MEEVVNLASFEFDVTRLNANVDSLRGKMFELNKQQEANKSAAKEYQKEINELVKVQGLLENANGETSDAYKENEARIQALTTAQKANYKVQQDLTQQIGKVRTELNQTVTQQNAYNTSTGEQTTLLNATNKALETNINNINEARASNKEILAIRNQLNPAIEEEASLISKLNARLDENNAFIKENASAYEQQKIQIGDYKNQIIEAAQALNPLNGGLTGFISRANEAGGVGPLMTTTFTAIRTGIIGATQAGLAFLATPIGAFLGALAIAVGIVVGAFKFMTASMNSTEEGSQKLAKITGAISGIFSGFFKVLKPFGEFLGTVFITYIEAVGEALDRMATGLADAAEFIGLSGVAKDIRGVQEQVKESAKAAMDLAAAEGELAKAQRESRKVQLQYQKDAEKLRQQRDDETKTVGERIRINEQLGLVLKKQLDEEMKLAEVALKVANLRLKSEGQTAEALDAQAAAQTELVDIQERIAGQESEQLAALNGLRKEAAAQEEERRQKAIDNSIRRAKEDLDYFIAVEGDKAKALDESLRYEETVSQKRLNALKKEYDGGKMSKRAYETEKLNITKEFTDRQIEITNQYASAEIELWKQTNRSLLEDSEFLSEELLAQEEARLQTQESLLLQQLAREMETDQLIIDAKKARNEQLTQADLEYQAKRLEIERQTDEQIETNRTALDTQSKERKLAQLEADKELEMLNAQGEYEEQLVAEQQRFDGEIARLDEQLRKRLITEQQYNDLRDAMEFENAENEKKINFLKEQEIRRQYAETFGNISKILGERTSAGKAAAIAEATMNTYAGVAQVWNTTSLLPEPVATISKVASTAVVLGSGLAAVKKITSTKTPSENKPSYARGVIGLSGGGTSTSDSIPANLSLGESVINANSTAMFPELLSQINQLGGGVGLNASSSIMSQQSITQGADNSQMSSVIANAVYEGSLMGTMRGSESGIVGLSNNRNIQANALD